MSSQSAHQPKAWIYDESGRVIREYDISTNQEITMDIKAMSTPDLVAEYNRLTGKSIKKFSSRSAGEQQVANARAAAAGHPAEAKAKDVKVKDAKVKKEPTGNASDAIAASWQNKNVAAARSKKDKVKVDGVEHRSVLAAFEALKLPISKHIPFRAKLKAQGRATFDGHTFTIVKAA